MRFLWQHIEQILAQYHGGLPLHHFLKGFFKKHPKLGSRDRKAIGHAVYSWYRVGKALAGNAGHSQEEQMQAAMYLCGGVPKILLNGVPLHWEIYPGSPGGSLRYMKQSQWIIESSRIFPMQIDFSAGIEKGEWTHSMLCQPRLFLRIRKNKDIISTIIQKAGIEYEWLSETCLALPNGTKVEALLPADSYVVQDASSQATGKYLKAIDGEEWWDCCSGAGGKSLILKDASPDIQLLTTDVRASILNNLKERFRLYHHALPEMAVLDAADESATKRLLGNRYFDGIICDVPCTGSGTWARTPESCYFFNPGSVTDYATRQQAILRNACNYLKEDGRLIYITCSVFRAENEDVIEAVAGECRMRIVSAGLINGLSIGADALFAAELRLA